LELGSSNNLTVTVFDRDNELLGFTFLILTIPEEVATPSSTAAQCLNIDDFTEEQFLSSIIQGQSTQHSSPAPPPLASQIYGTKLRLHIELVERGKLLLFKILELPSDTCRDRELTCRIQLWAQTREFEAELGTFNTTALIRGLRVGMVLTGWRVLSGDVVFTSYLLEHPGQIFSDIDDNRRCDVQLKIPHCRDINQPAALIRPKHQTTFLTSPTQDVSEVEVHLDIARCANPQFSLDGRPVELERASHMELIHDCKWNLLSVPADLLVGFVTASIGLHSLAVDCPANRALSAVRGFSVALDAKSGYCDPRWRRSSEYAGPNVDFPIVPFDAADYGFPTYLHSQDGADHNSVTENTLFTLSLLVAERGVKGASVEIGVPPRPSLSCTLMYQ